MLHVSVFGVKNDDKIWKMKRVECYNDCGHASAAPFRRAALRASR
jgi:hypothetical protein